MHNVIPALHLKNAKDINTQQNINRDFLGNGNMDASSFFVVCLSPIFSTRTTSYSYIQEK